VTIKYEYYLHTHATTHTKVQKRLAMLMGIVCKLVTRTTTTFPKAQTPLNPRQTPQRGHLRPPLLPCRQDLRDLLVEPAPRSATTSIPPRRSMRLPFPPRRLVQTQRQIQNGLPAHQRLLVVIPNIDVEHVHWPIHPPTLIVQVFEYGVEAALLARNDHIGDAGLGAREALIPLVLQPWFPGDPVLEALGEGFDVEVAAEHVEQAVVRVEGGVLRGQLVVDRAVGGAVKLVDVGLRYGRAGKAHEGASAEGDGGEVRRRELEVGFHGAGEG
jgi:hypothetical protein